MRAAEGQIDAFGSKVALSQKWFCYTFVVARGGAVQARVIK
jgi:hypothetical protein